MSDLIDRQAAIDAIDEALHRIFAEPHGLAEKILKDVPSAQPEIIRCKDCEWFDESYPLGTYADGVFRCNRVKRLWMEKDAFCSYGERRDSNG